MPGTLELEPGDPRVARNHARGASRQLPEEPCDSAVATALPAERLVTDVGNVTAAPTGQPTARDWPAV
jgi:hypothetical protein